jgi:predicted RNase H-like nuclease (RuvC/YqgF family)
MDWKSLGVFATLLAVFVTMWWQLDRKIEYEISTLDSEISALDSKLERKISALDSKIDRSISALERKIDQLTVLLTNNLIALNRDVGELKGTAHTHPSPDSPVS